MCSSAILLGLWCKEGPKLSPFLLTDMVIKIFTMTSQYGLLTPNILTSSVNLYLMRLKYFHSGLFLGWGVHRHILTLVIQKYVTIFTTLTYKHLLSISFNNLTTTCLVVFTCMYTFLIRMHAWVLLHTYTCGLHASTIIVYIDTYI